MKFLDCFAGIGGFRLGMEMAGHTCIGHIEIDKFANASYQAMHQPRKEEYFAKDITTADPETLPDFDILCGGFPCQAFSVAGKRRGFEDTRGTLIFELLRIARIKKPSYLLLENVRNLLHHDEGRTFEKILKALDESGYDAQWQLLDSKDFGVPQSRKRVYIVGYHREKCTRKIFFVTGEDHAINPKRIKKVGNVSKNGTSRSGDIVDVSGLSPTLCALGSQKDPVKIVRLTGGSQGERIYDGKNGISVTLSSSGGGMGAKTGLYAFPVLTPDRSKKRQNGRRFKENGEPMFTITAQDRHGLFLKNRVRRLTPKECFRLQGFPDEYFDKARAVCSDSQLYKQAGNGVTVNVVYAIAKKMKGE